MSGGHVFITRGDLTRISCDAWLLPSSETCSVARSWLTHAPALREFVSSGGGFNVELPADWTHEGVRTVHVPVDGSLPQPWLTNVGGWEGIEVEWYLEGARQFVLAAGASVGGTPARHGRERPLLALPVVGTRFGGAEEQFGDMVMELVALLHRLVAESPADIALITQGTVAFAAAQRARRRLIDEHFDGDNTTLWPLDERLTEHATRLAECARTKRLVLFLGAGVSTAAGLPTWADLLERLEERAGFDDDERTELARLDSLDRARVVQLRLAETDRILGELVAAEMASDQYSLAHTLLASLPVDEVVTTNYDQLFEFASSDADRRAAVLPYEPSSTEDRWLLKLHGSIDRPDDIVLTREDYLRYADRRAALAGIVQALLITRHMLFVGFSLTDDNFHRIVDEVRKAVRGGTAGASAEPVFGTSMHLLENPLMERLWADDLQAIAIQPAGSDSAAAARTLEVLLDLLLARATDNRAHVLDDRFLAALSPEEKEIRRALRVLADDVSEQTKQVDAWEPIAALLRDFGGHA